MTSENNEKRTKLILERSRTARAFPENESLWGDEISRMTELIKDHARALERKSGDKIEDLPILSIAIFGTYGSGKSTLLRTFAHRINENKNLSQVFSLPVIVPNIIKKSDHFLYTFLATALEADDKKQNPEGHSPVPSPVHQVFCDLSEDLQVFDDSGPSSENDPLGYSLERLNRHSSTLHLKDRMDDFLDNLALDLNGSKSSIVLLPVDDADMSLDNLVSTLDTYRRYLRHPRLVAIFSFTGRLAEELLRSHFQSKLTDSKNQDPDMLLEAATDIRIPENLALQYLGKLFPVRNRIRLGPAPSRIQKSVLKDGKDGSGETPSKPATDNKILTLLETTSKLLFGFSDWPLMPAVRLPLCAVTARRQIQIVDAMLASGMNFYINKIPPDKGPSGRPNTYSLSISSQESWGKLFDSAIWALLNVHRDILREYDLNLDDLYSWSSKGLRHVILESILKGKEDTRKKLIERWRYRMEDRRGQMLSLLAANTFRPRSHAEEPQGDEPEKVSLLVQFGSPIKDLDSQQKRALGNSISTRKGALWFIDLWLGFYLPQALCFDLGEGSDKSKTIRGSGWTLASGPVHAIHAARDAMVYFSAGMIILSPQDPLSLAKETAQKKAEKKENDLQKIITYLKSKNVEEGALQQQRDEILKAAEKRNKEIRQIDTTLLILIWCYFGYDNEESWAAVSLWRGLGLLGQLLQVDIDLKGAYFKEPIYSEAVRRNHIIKILKNHISSGQAFGSTAKGKKFSGQEVLKKWDTELLDTAIEILADDIIEWLEEFNPETKRIFPMRPGEITQEDLDALKAEAKKRASKLMEKEENLEKDLSSLKEKENKLNIDILPQSIYDIRSITKESKSISELKKKYRVSINEFEDSQASNSEPVNKDFDKIEEKNNRIVKLIVDEVLEFSIIEYEQEIKRRQDKILEIRPKIHTEPIKAVKLRQLNQLKKEYQDLLKQKRKIIHFGKKLTRLYNAERRLHEQRVDLQQDLPEEPDTTDSKMYDFKRNTLEWDSCYLRRLHGDNLLGTFWPALHAPFFQEDRKLKGEDKKDTGEGLNARLALEKWCRILLRYWHCGQKYFQDKEGQVLKTTKREPKMATLLASCPFLYPFSFEAMKHEEFSELNLPKFVNLVWDPAVLEKLKP